MDSLLLDPGLVATVSALTNRRVEYVVIGDVARAVHSGGGAVITIAIVPNGYARNVERLVGALMALRVALPPTGGGGATQPIELTPAILREMAPCRLDTTYMAFDLDFEPAGTAGYADLFDWAEPIDLGAQAPVLVAAEQDLIRIEAGRGSAPRVSPSAGRAAAHGHGQPRRR